MLQFILSQKNKKLLLHKGYTHNLVYTGASFLGWRCTYYSISGCKGYVRTSSDKRTGIFIFIFRPIFLHCRDLSYSFVRLLGSITSETAHDTDHEGKPVTLAVKKVNNTLKRRARKTHDRPGRLVSDNTAMVEREVAVRLPQEASMKRTVRRARAADSEYPVHPQTREELVLPPAFCTTLRGEKPFLINDDGNFFFFCSCFSGYFSVIYNFYFMFFIVNELGVDKRFLIFTTKTNLRTLRSCDIWFADGTFDTVPHLFKQLYTIHGLFQDNTPVPLVYILLVNKSEELYFESISAIKTYFRRSLRPRKIMLDFELSAINAFARAFPGTEIKGCRFHLNQCWWRGIQRFGLTTNYNTDATFNYNIQLLKALMFVPPRDVLYAYDKLLKTKFFVDNDDLLNDFLDYVERTWLGKKHRNGNIVPPKYELELWNQHEAVKSGDPMTTNVCESWHNRFAKLIGQSHANVFNFLQKIQQEQSTTETLLDKLSAGEEPPVKKSRSKVRSLSEVVDSFKKRRVVDYLHNVANAL